MECDFCSHNEVSWCFPCKSFDLEFSSSTGDWAACQRCYQLIQANAREKLAERTMFTIGCCSTESAVITYLCVRSLHDAFFSHRTGLPSTVKNASHRCEVSSSTKFLQ